MRRGSGGYRGKDHFGRRHRKVRAVVFADADEGEPDLVGELSLLDDIADGLCL